ncbi:hypothetical protein J4474_00910 [Candidatus Pacearchaeota archaeon]|nr:hypothetical protein [Candidatus Pacearchaeota archaeon]
MNIVHKPQYPELFVKELDYQQYAKLLDFLNSSEHVLKTIGGNFFDVSFKSMTPGICPLYQNIVITPVVKGQFDEQEKITIDKAYTGLIRLLINSGEQ